MQPATMANATLADFSQEMIYIMGFSFILGSLFTIFILLVLDFMRRNNKPGA